MPKKAHGRPAKAKSRPRRQPGTRPAVAPATDSPELQNGLAGSGGAVMASGPGVTTAARPSASPTAARRAAATQRRPVATINYHYLRRDITTLAVLAPSMIVLLVLAYIVFH